MAVGTWDFDCDVFLGITSATTSATSACAMISCCRSAIARARFSGARCANRSNMGVKRQVPGDSYLLQKRNTRIRHQFLGLMFISRQSWNGSLAEPKAMHILVEIVRDRDLNSKIGA